MKILLDTNFVITCVKQKIDFISLADELTDERVEWLIPFEVLQELETISSRKGEKKVDKESAKIGLDMIKLINPTIININNKNVDQGIIDYVKDKKIVLASLDKGLRKKINNKILVISNVKCLEILES